MDELNKNNFKWINMQNREFLENLIDKMTQESASAKTLEAIGSEVFDKDISFSKLSIFLDTFSYKMDPKHRKLYKKQINHLARGYMIERLPLEIASIKLGIHNNPNFVIKKDLQIIDELLIWIDGLIKSFINETQAPRIEARILEFEKFIQERAGVFLSNDAVKKDFLKTNKELYECAIEAVNFFEQKEYYYFALIYIEMIALFLKMVTLLSGMFLEEDLLSVYVDPITLMPNRFQLLRDLELFHNSYILIVNIKSFGKLNVTYGFETGDIILKKVAAYLKISSAVKSYRIYGDEFAILFHKEEEIEEFYEHLNRDLSIVLEGEEHDIFFYGAYNKFENNALEICEFALAKGNKKSLLNSKSIQKIEDAYRTELTMIQKLKQIMLTDKIVPHFQPIYSELPDKKIIKYEVLMRLEYEKEILSPDQFLDILVEAPFYTEFTKSMLLKAFNTFHGKDMTFSVNFTVTDIMDKSIKLFLETLISKHPETAKNLTIEITETEALKDFDDLNAFIHHFKAKGVQFSLDDFGSGYANFAQFAKLEIDYIKIDGTIVSKIITDPKMQKILESILNFTETLDVKVIAEYVSDKEIFEYLKNRVDMLQGYYIGKPEPYLL